MSTTPSRSVEVRQLQPDSAPRARGLLQRKCACGGTPGPSGECEECRKKKLQRKASEPAAGSLEIPAIVHDVLRSPGMPLDAETRTFMGTRFGQDFSQVRIHADARSAESAASVNSLAYTVGRDVVFGSGQYTPTTLAGQKLLAHELTHVVQQRNATGGLALADTNLEREADASAEAIATGRTAPATVSAAVTPQLARQQDLRETKKLPPEPDGRQIEVTRSVTPGKCVERPKTTTSSSTEFTRSKASIKLGYCRGRTSAGATGEIDYSDIVKRAVKAVPNFFTNKDPSKALSDLEQSIKSAEPTAKVVINVQVGGVKGKVTATGKGSIAEGVSGEVEATVGGRIGSTGVEVGGKISGGSNQPTTGSGTITITPGAGAPEIPNCFDCTCADPTFTFSCVVHDPQAPPKKPKVEPPLFVPLFFEYEKSVPRAGWEKSYDKALDFVIDRLRAGYTIARIEGGTSPEGTLKKKTGFEGNISLAQRRAEQAQKDLRAGLDKAIGREQFKMRSADAEGLRRLQQARDAAGYGVTGFKPGGEPSTAELFGTEEKNEVRDRDLHKFLKKRLAAPKEGEVDPLAAEHVIGESLPADIRAEVEAEVTAFREGKRDGKKLTEKESLETLYRPLRRALIVLDPPRLEAPKFDAAAQLTLKDLEKITGRSVDCLPEHEDLFDKTLQDSWYEGECRAKGGVGSKVK